jgi:carboxymethylenebutenolidase
MIRRAFTIALAPLALAAGACTKSSADEHAEHAQESAGTVAASAAQDDRSLPPSAATAAARLASSPRHGEWAMVKTSPTDSVRAWVVYPERSGKAPVVVVIHEIFGLTDWIRGVADQLAAEGYIAIAPDLLTMKLQRFAPSDPPRDSATAAIRTLDAADVQRDLDAVAKYGMSLPAAQAKWGVVGFCWGGSTSFATAAHANPALGAAVVYYGTAPAAPQLSAIKAPVLGLYGGDDARVDATVPPTDSAMKALGKPYSPNIFPGAGHGFLRAQTDTTGGAARASANMEATRKAWPQTVGFFRQHLGR